MRVRISGWCTRRAAIRAAGRTGAMLLAIGMLLNVPGGARAGKTTITNENVTTIVHDLDTNGTPLHIRSDDYQGGSLNEATYSASLDPNLSSDIYAGTWFLRMYSQSIRMLYVRPNDAINSSQPAGPPPILEWQIIEVAARCYDQNLNQVPLENILTSSGNCLLMVDFYFGGAIYKLAMGPSLSQTLEAHPAIAPATGLVTVICNSVSNGQCVNWTITPNMATGSSNPPTVADLFGPGGTGKTKTVSIGQYYDTFRIDITYP